METLIYKKNEYTTINESARCLNVSVSLIYYYAKMGRLTMVSIDKLKLVELNSLMLINDYLKFRYTKK